MSSHLHQQDCIAGMRALPDDYAQICIADPPYNIGKDFGADSSDNLPLADYLAWTKEWLVEAKRVTKKSGLIYIYGFAEILAHIAVQEPVTQQHWLVWHYKNKAVPSSKFWQRSTEMILCLWQQAERPKLNIDAIRQPYSQQFLQNAAGKKRKNTKGRYGASDSTIYQAHEQGALPRDLLEVPALAGGAGRKERWFYCHECDSAYPPTEMEAHQAHELLKHPTQKPLQLTETLIASYAQAGDILLVPFAGSGSECVVAKQMGLDYCAFEQNPDYVKLAQSWLQQTDNPPIIAK